MADFLLRNLCGRWGAIAGVDETFHARIKDEISIRVPTEHCHLFDQDTGRRIGG